ncbi:MAG: caspase family protein, partial [Thermodesulfobacteriota bacterium]|nr:caspase family protein [Thermodesulfobacteriota bacterium]
MRKKNSCALIFFPLSLIFSLTALNSDSSGMNKSSTLSIKKSLPESRLSYFNDSFDKQRDEIWRLSQVAHYGHTLAKWPDISFEKGKLIIKTKTGDFCKGGLGSKYSLRGDFDIQADCHMDFLEDTPDMDQVLLFVVEGKYTGELVSIGLLKRATQRSIILTAHLKKGKRPLSSAWAPIGDFHGSLRIVRMGDKISTFYKVEEKSDWINLNTYQGLTEEVVLGLGVKNFSGRRKKFIKADSVVMAGFDNFRINAAQEIIEKTKPGGPSSTSTGCDKAPTFFWKGKFSKDKKDTYKYYKDAIDLCPGFIRPYELIGNMYRKDGEIEKALQYFKKAAELETTNHKLYYLLSKLLFEKGDMNEASINLQKSLSIRGDYPKTLELKVKIENALDSEGPKILLFEPATRRGVKVVYMSENITVRGMVADKSGVSWVKVNQSDTHVDERGNFLRDIPIEVGDNRINVKASDKLGNQSKITMIVERKKPVTSLAGEVINPSRLSGLYEKSFAVVIGINQYEKWPALECAINDAKAIRRKLEAAGFNEIITIFDKEATRRRILTELFHSLPQKVGHNDRVMFYFAGHGQTEDLPNGGKRGYIVPVDADTSNYSSTAISMEQVRSLSSRISAKHILYVMDSCYSGLGLSRSYGVSTKLSG